MRSPALALLIALTAATSLSMPAGADQRDRRLDTLFADLQSADAADAARIQNRIWEVWHESGTEIVNLLLLDAQEAMQLGLVEQAEKQYDAAIDLAPDFAEAWNRRATLRFMRENYVGSIEDIQKVLELEPRHFGALSGLGLIYDRLDEEEAALQAFREALMINPHLSDIRQRAEAIEKSIRDREI